MSEVLEEMKEKWMKEKCFGLSNHEGLGGWVYSLSCHAFNSFNYSSTISIEYYDYYAYYGVEFYTDDEDEN